MKTAKDKAKELVEKFEDYVFYDPHKELPVKEFQIECAKIAVDEIIEENRHLMCFHQREGQERLNYWQEVKNELNKML